jgi:hypothetical protein
MKQSTHMAAFATEVKSDPEKAGLVSFIDPSQLQLKANK